MLKEAQMQRNKERETMGWKVMQVLDTHAFCWHGANARKRRCKERGKKGLCISSHTPNAGPKATASTMAGREVTDRLRNGTSHPSLSKVIFLLVAHSRNSERERSDTQRSGESPQRAVTQQSHVGTSGNVI